VLPTKDVLGILRDNLILRGSILPLSRDRATGWSEGLAIPRGGRTVLYTGLMYQLMPSMIGLEKVTARFEDSSLNRLTFLGRLGNRAINGSRLTSVLVKSEDRERFDGVLRDIATLLRAAGVDFGYLYEEELYAGALAHDQGLCQAFERQVLRVHELFRRCGVKRVITVDPHTTNVLRSILPNVVPNGGPKVESYLEVLAERGWKPARPVERSVAIHDSCVYARHEGIIDEPRQLLRGAGVEVLEPEYSGRGTFCCGGPIESLFPGKARSIADTRVGQLKAVGEKIVTMCPICLVNLEAAARKQQAAVGDISSWLVEAYSA
jgi:Fe-S oxidoreductase